MLSVEEALEAILSRIAPLGTELVELAATLGRVGHPTDNNELSGSADPHAGRLVAAFIEMFDAEDERELVP